MKWEIEVVEYEFYTYSVPNIPGADPTVGFVV